MLLIMAGCMLKVVEDLKAQKVLMMWTVKEIEWVEEGGEPVASEDGKETALIIYLH